MCVWRHLDALACTMVGVPAQETPLSSKGGADSCPQDSGSPSPGALRQPCSEEPDVVRAGPSSWSWMGHTGEAG